MSKGKYRRRAKGHLFTKEKNSRPKPRQVADTEENQPPSPVAVEEKQPGPSCSSDIQPHPPTNVKPRPNLRPRRKGKKVKKNLGNRVVNLDLIISMFNSMYRDHQSSAAHCNAIEVKLLKERKVGLGSDLTFACRRCNFVSETYQTYKPRLGSGSNRDAAATNMLLASALQDTSIGVEKANILLASLDIPPPSKSHMQTLTEEASQLTVQLNEEDMAEKRQLVVQHNQDLGVADPNQMHLSFDCRYNANRMVSSCKPGQAASQSYRVAIKNNTGSKYVVGLAIENKLCWTGAFLKNQGIAVDCPGGHPGCTANISYMEPHLERRMAYDIARQMHQEDITVRTLTTDGDTKAFLGMQDFYKDVGKASTVTRQADPQHLGSSQIRRARRAHWSKEMFPRHRTRQARQIALTAFAKDIKARCSKIIHKLRQQGDGDITQMLNDLPDVCAATVDCYSGNCGRCPEKSLVCSGIGGEGDWWFESKFLPTHGIREGLKMTETDRELLKSVLDIRLSEQAVYSVASNTSTQKCEAFNRGVLSTLPKEVNLSKTFPGKLHAKTLQLNNDTHSAIQEKVKLITGQNLSSGASRYLQCCSKQNLKRKARQQSSVFKFRRHQNRARMEHDYSCARSDKQSGEPEYVKGQLD